MEEVNNYHIISQPKKPHIVEWIGLILFTFFFLIFLGLSIADASWASFSITTIVYMTLLTTMLLAMFFKKIYYLSASKIIIADHKNQYINELPFSEIYKWNHYSEKEDEYLVVSGQDTSVAIEKSKYTNFDELVDFFTKTDLVKDTSLRRSGVTNETIQEVVIHTLYFSLFIAFTLSFLFWVITYSKSDSTEIQHFQGHIQTIETFRKSSSVRIALKEYPTISFRTQAEVITKFSLTNKADLVGKKVRIGIFKSDYEWKIKNKTIRMLDWNSIPYLNAVSLEQTGQL